MRNYKRLSDCPLLLQQIIDAVNDLPFDTKAIEEGLYDLLYDDFDGKLDSERAKREVKTLIKQKPILKYVQLDMPSKFSFSIAYQNFFDLITARPILESIASQNYEKLYGERSVPNKEISSIKINFPITGWGTEIEFSGTLYLDKKGNIRPRNSGLIGVFSTYNIPFNRIRFCPVCEQICWVKRLDAKSCGKKQCSDILSQRNLRIKKRDKINEQRRENYKRKKELKAIKEKKNGTL